MKYPVQLYKSDEGFAVSCPVLPGCWSQGATRSEALVNIREAITLWLEVAFEDRQKEDAEGEVIYDSVDVAPSPVFSHA
jgi:predicted RNase H-like HicB family nuclease